MLFILRPRKGKSQSRMLAVGMAVTFRDDNDWIWELLGTGNVLNLGAV